MGQALVSRLSLYSNKPYQGVTIQVNDGGNEIFVANSGAVQGWNDIIVPFKAFNKFPYYQPPDAVQNGKFDYEGIRAIDFKPAGDGTSGSFRSTTFILTNIREASSSKALASREFKVTGDLAKSLRPRSMTEFSESMPRFGTAICSTRTRRIGQGGEP